MPELPDLQVFSRNLSKKLVGQTVKKIHAINKKKLKVPETELKKNIEGATLSSVYRDGKELHFVFDNGHILGLHLMLRGRLHLFRGTPFSPANRIPDPQLKALAKAIKSVLTHAEKSIAKNYADLISGEVRDFMSIHNPKRTHSPTGAKIQVKKTGARKTYYTDEQVLY